MQSHLRQAICDSPSFLSNSYQCVYVSVHTGTNGNALKNIYRQTSNIRGTLVGNKIGDH